MKTKAIFSGMILVTIILSLIFIGCAAQTPNVQQGDPSKSFFNDQVTYPYKVRYANAMAASWQFWSIWPIFSHMIKDLPKLQYLGQTLTIENSYQYGPICIDKGVRGTGVLEKLFDFAREHMAKRYPILVTFINKTNRRSYEAHTRKLGLITIQEFEFNNNVYYELVYDTSKKVKQVG